MKENEFFICEEDNIFDTLSSLYEDLKPSPYADAPGLDLSLDYEGAEEYLDQAAEELIERVSAADYGVNFVDFQCGDILLAEVFQYGSNINLDHKIRPFLVVYANAYKAYGFQLTTAQPASLLNYLVDIPNYASCGLRRPSSLRMNSIVAVDLSRLICRIGHITEEHKQIILDKLHELKGNLEELDTYGWWTLEKIDQTITNLERISC
jgi:hypothetical protein